MNWQTLLLLLLTLSLCSFTIIGHRWFKKITKYYWFWLGVSLFYLIFVISVTWWKLWAFVGANWSLLVPADQFKMQWEFMAIALGTHICYFFMFALPICFIVDPTRQAARALAPIAFLASAMVELVIVPFGFRAGNPVFTLDYIIFGDYWDWSLGPDLPHLAFRSLDYFIHVGNLLFAIGAIMNTPRYGWKGLASVGGAYGGTYLYVGSLVAALGIKGNTGGLTPWDFTDGIFASTWGAIFKGNTMAAQATFFIAIIFIQVLFVFFIDFVLKRGWYKYGNAKSGVWWKYWDYEHYALNTNEKDWGKLAKYMKEVR